MSDEPGTTVPAPDFSDCVQFADAVGFYIHPDKLLQLLEDRARVLAERAAVLGLNPTLTEGLRGRRAEALTISHFLHEALKKWQQTQKI